MNAPGLISGIILALLISLGAGLSGLLLGAFIAQSTLFSLILAAVSLVYLLYLLKHGNARVGRVLIVTAWALISLAGWLFELPLVEQVLLQSALIWLVRSLYFHASVFAALLDLGLVSMGLAASAWAILNTGSLATAIWSFLLVQALFGWIPAFTNKPGAAVFDDRPGQSSFQTAHRVAVDAVRKLSQP